MALQRQHVSIEFTDGRIVEDLRIILADKRRYETTAKNRGWDADKDQVTLNAFLAWCAAKRLNVYDGTFESFVDGDVVDLSIEAHAVDPTQTAQSVEP